MNLKDIKDSFKRDGFVKVNGLFDQELIQKLLETINNSENLQNSDGAIFDDISDKKMLRYVSQPQNYEPIFL